ncbi:serpin-ZX-like [Rhododendron vialii]|uniref:serpin-ZX-like n=1 Tax=Rhododendron vialii TaxID=182163 RepID=UPI00265F7460|nr:serpin-ZX-like [Rhododendron vialii]
MPTGGPKLSFANGAWLDQLLSLKPSFKLVVDTVYKAALNHVDFQTKAVEVTNEVNQWAETETNGIIKEVLPSGSFDASARLIFTNALYFKGTWTDVSLSFAKQILSQSASKDSNLVFSPPLIHVVLDLIAAGSNGPTQSQVLSLLNSESTDNLNSLSSHLSLVFADCGPTGGPKLSFANGVWVDQSLSFKPSLKEVVDTVYKAALNHVDFRTKVG